MAQKPDGKLAKSVAVTFTRPAAERIAHVVRTVERSGRDTKGPAWNPRMEGGSGGVFFHIGTFTGAWAISSVNVVTFKYQTTTPNTASVTNLFFPYPENGTKDCAIAKEGTAWFLVDVPFATATMTFIQSAPTATLQYIQSAPTATLQYIQSAITATISYITGGSAQLNTATCQIVFTPETASALVLSVAPVTATAVVLSVAPVTATALVLSTAPVTATMTYVTFKV